MCVYHEWVLDVVKCFLSPSIDRHIRVFFFILFGEFSCLITNFFQNEVEANYIPLSYVFLPFLFAKSCFFTDFLPSVEMKQKRSWFSLPAAILLISCSYLNYCCLLSILFPFKFILWVWSPGSYFLPPLKLSWEPPLLPHLIKIKSNSISRVYWTVQS